MKILPVLITCNHVLYKKDIKIGKTIEYTLDNDKKIFNKNRWLKNSLYKWQFWFHHNKKKKKRIYLLLEIDNEILKNKEIKDLNETSIYLLHYPNWDTTQVSFGTIKAITENTYTIHHNVKVKRAHQEVLW